MSAISDGVMRRLHKIKALAERGVDGEQAAAQAMLESILTRHNLTLDDIEAPAPVRNWVEVSFSGKYERTLMTHVILKVCQIAGGELTIKQRKRARSHYYVQLSAAEHVEVEFVFELMRKALDDEFDKVLVAFLHTNKLFGPRAETDDDEDDDKPDTRTWEERMRHRQIAQMSLGMSPVNVNKAIKG